MLRKQL